VIDYAHVLKKLSHTHFPAAARLVLVQLGFLIAQGSEFAFVLLTVPAIRTLIGGNRSTVAVAGMALSLVFTPAIAAAGRWLAGSLRQWHATASTGRTQGCLNSFICRVDNDGRGSNLLIQCADFEGGIADVKEAPVPTVQHDVGDQRLLLMSEAVTSIDLAGRNADRRSVREARSVALEPMINAP
jgi:hypothetical protein